MKARSVPIFLLLPLVLMAQAPRNVAPLRYWPAPLYWQPTHGDSSLTPRPELFGAGKAATPEQTPENSLVFVGMTPCRIADTRTGFGFSGDFGPPSLTGHATRAFPIQASTTCSIPAIAQAYSLNLTVVPGGPMGYLTIWPVGSPQPNASALNDTLGGIVANAAIVQAGNDVSGSVNVFVSDGTDLVIDINGYYAPQSGITLTQGTAGAPSVSFAGDAATGMYSSGAGIVNMAAGGTQALSVGGANLNTALGVGSLAADTTGANNTAVGNAALSSNTTGSFNTATGQLALNSNTSGSNNTANGQAALQSNDVGGNNTAIGQSALQSNTSGTNNTAVGLNALQLSTTPINNTASGAFALANNTTGSTNTATGMNALNQNTIGSGNTANGTFALSSNNTGGQNEASGSSALFMNTTGGHGTAVGFSALYNNTSGFNNIGIGFQAAISVSGDGSNNIHIGSQGASADSGTIRLGTPGTQLSFFTAGVRGVTTGNNDAVPVVIDSNGQFGTVSSSIRFKENVHDMADASNGLLKLRPVTYQYKQPYGDGSKPLDYGLIAEEVATVYPDLVVRGADGQVETVQYQKLTPMLLNELQKQHADASEQREQIAQQQDLIRRLEARLAAMEAALPAKPETTTGK